ncbi:DUF4244 domain-containing protein [Labedaea rhizosphaerae]|uniref:Uncharacterized protein DUF4244 n=1 Tax=Labedaea rhizosphaerae TaxID=598644 RepID=A0A4R6SNH5_LABRH|nr:DUF4244 domain-containing protein [Labedaea rhizosphaerae]TDQ04743.1 uncharacterized protein DUF4244 [Labedaea rhizosphaerae]
MNPTHARLNHLVTADDGMSTVEYAVGTVAAAAFALVLYHIVTGDDVLAALTGIISRALALNL